MMFERSSSLAPPTDGTAVATTARYVRIGMRVGRLSRHPEFWYYLSKILPGAFSFVSILLLVRILGEVGYGSVALGVAAATVGGGLAAGWLAQAMLRDSGLHRIDSLPRWLRVASYAVAVPVVLVLSVGFGDSRSAGLVIASALLGVASTIQLLSATDLQSTGQGRSFARSEFVRVAGGAALATVLALVSGEPWAVVLGLAVGAVVAAIRPPTTRPASAPPTLSSSDVNRMWSYGWPMAMWFVLATVLQLGDRFIITLLLGPGPAGYYSAIFDTVTRATTMLLFPLVLAGHPAIMTAWNNGDQVDARRQCLRLARRQRRASLVVLLIGVAVSPIAVHIIGVRPLGGDWVIVILLLLGGLLWQAALVAHKPLELEGRTRYMLFAITIAVTVNLSTTVLLVPLLGVLAAAVTTALGAMVYLLLVLPSWRFMGRATAPSGTEKA